MSPRKPIDVSDLPDVALDGSALFWWGTVGLIVIESMSFAILIATAIYLRLTVVNWPPPTIAAPDLALGVLGVGLLLASCVPLRAAERLAGRGRPEEDAPKIRAFLLATLAIIVLFLVVRFLEFPGLHCKWNSNAYGSVQWATLGTHLLEGVAGLGELGVLAVLFFTSHVEEKHLLDVRACALFWYFIALGWLPLFAAVYLLPRFS
jgi:cytochrome c oxidase subunit I+III